MRFHEVEAFLAVAEELHFGRAAARLHVSTPSVSQAIRGLERRVGAPLFERTSRRVRMTPVGEWLLGELRPAYDRMERALREAGRQLHPGVLRVGVATSVPSDVSTAPIEAFEREHPQWPVIRSAHPNTDPMRWSGTWPVDVFIGWGPADSDFLHDMGIRVGPALSFDERALLVAAGHPLARRTAVDVEELADHPMLHPRTMPERPADGWVPAATPKGRPLQRMSWNVSASLEEAIVLVGRGDVVHLTVASLRPDNPHVVTVPVVGLPPMKCAPAWPADAEPETVSEFVRIAGQVGRARRAGRRSSSAD